jgi:threonylcarbamoyladenosine tRNA methylthiotransferase MtaB
MPPVAGPVIRERAARLRAAGAARQAAWLTGRVGERHRVLMEKPRMGRTEHFAEVHFGADRVDGAIVEASINGSAADHLIAA